MMQAAQRPAAAQSAQAGAALAGKAGRERGGGRIANCSCSCDASAILSTPADLQAAMCVPCRGLYM